MTKTIKKVPASACCARGGMVEFTSPGTRPRAASPMPRPLPSVPGAPAVLSHHVKPEPEYLSEAWRARAFAAEFKLPGAPLKKGGAR
jgi:hypothetical protein